MDKYIGRLLDNRYEILDVIGTGGMAVVYKARCHRLNRLVAIKILKDDFLQDDDFRRRFHAESQAVAMLGHPNIVAVYDVSSSADADYIVMELIDGITLKQYMENKGVLNWKETLHFAIQIAKALEHAHSRGIVHRDIKPHNIMVLKNGSVKVADFGIARVMSKGNTLTKEALGSVHYISPEQAKGGRVDVRSDLYSLGVVMYEMMSGRPPYDGESPVAVAIQHINGGAALPSVYNPNIPGGLEQIIMKAMAHDADSRYESATVMLADMDEFRKDPAMLFDYNTPPLDVVTQLPKPQPIPDPKPRTTAEKVVEKAQPRPKKKKGTKPQTASEKKRQEQAQNDKVAIVAIAVCLTVITIALAIVLFLSLNGGMTTPSMLIKVPNLLGMQYDQVQLPEGLQIEIYNESHNEEYPAGQIFQQEPKGDVEVGKGTKIFVSVSLGPVPEELIYMPNLLRLTQNRAEEQLNNLSLGLSYRIEEVFDDEIPAGEIVRTVPAAKAELTAGQEVVLYISAGVKKARMPNVVGMDVDKATSVLKTAGFDTPEYKYVYNAASKDEVVSQSVECNTMVSIDTVIVLEISKGPEEVTEPPTEPTTEPTEPQVTKTITIALPTGMTEDYVLTITHNGQVVYESTIDPEATKLEVQLTGSGIKYYKINIPGMEPEIKEVDFTTP